MNRKWIEEKIRKEEKNRQSIWKSIEDAFKHQNFMSEKELNAMLQSVKEKDICDKESIIFKLEWTLCAYEDIKEYYKWLKDTNIYDLVDQYTKSCHWERFYDTDMLEVDGDIIITDPCYIIRKLGNEITDDDWAACGYGGNMENLGISRYLTRDTIYGDWSCTTFDTTNGKYKGERTSIGRFCADSGQVSVFLLDEILKYNPDFDLHITNPRTATLIKNFKGSVQIICKVEDNNEEYPYASVIVIGSGVNKDTGKPFRFETRQNG